MALAVDAGGKVKASPKTGKIFNAPKTGGGSPAQLVDDIGVNEVANFSQQPERDNSTQDNNAVFEPLKYNNVTPQQTSPVAFSTTDAKPVSFWDSMRQNLSGVITPNDDMSSVHYNKNDELVPSVVEGHVAGEGDVNRWGEEYKDDPIANTDVGRLHESSIGNTRSNDVYEDLFKEIGGLSDDELYREISHRPSSSEYGWEANKISPQDLKNVHNVGNQFDEVAVDDGTYDYAHLTSPKILGSQLKLYAQNGFAPGLDADQIEQIDPDFVYDKAELALDPDVRFQPYLPDVSTLVRADIEAPINKVASLSGEMANLRGNISKATNNGYKIDFDNGKQKFVIDGPEYDKTGYGFVDSVSKDMDNNPARFFISHEGEDQSWSQYANRYESQNPDGDVEYHYGMPISQWEPNNDGTWEIEFEDGSVETVGQDYIDSFPSDDDGVYLPSGLVRATPNNDETWSREYTDGSTATVTSDWLESNWENAQRAEKVDVTGMGFDTNRLNGGVTPKAFVDDDGREWTAVQAAASAWVPNYVMSDGTVLSYDDALAIATDSNGRSENPNLQDGQSVDYEFNNLIPFLPNPENQPLVWKMMNPLTSLTNKPVRLSSVEPISIDEKTGEVEWDKADFFGNPWERVFDLTAGSLPIMLPMKYSMPISAATGIEDLYGAYNYDATRDAYSYRPNNGSGAVASMATPINEQLVGPVGEGIITPFSWILNGKTGPLAAIGRGALGAAEEGVEEILGNVFDEYGEQGLSRMFGPYLDENGQVVDREYQAAEDEYGRPMRQEWDPNGDILKQLADRAYYAGVLPYHDGEWGFQQDALVNNLNSFYGGAWMSLPSSVVGSVAEDAHNRSAERETLDRLAQMGVTGTYNVPKKPKKQIVAPDSYLKQWR